MLVQAVSGPPKRGGKASQHMQGKEEASQNVPRHPKRPLLGNFLSEEDTMSDSYFQHKFLFLTANSRFLVQALICSPPPP